MNTPIKNCMNFGLHNVCFVIGCIMCLFAGQTKGGNLLEGRGVVTTYNADGTISRTEAVDFHGYLSSNGYSFSVTYSNGFVQKSVHDGTYTYLVADSAGSQSRTTDVHPAHILDSYYPMDADVFSRCLVFFSDWHNHRKSHIVITNDPWLDPRHNLAFEATTQHIRASTETEFQADYTVDPKLVRSLLKHPSKAKFVGLWVKPDKLTLWSRGYVEQSGHFTNSTWTITTSNGSNFGLKGVRYYDLSSQQLRGRVFEILSLNIKLVAADKPQTALINPEDLNLSVFDHRLQDRDHHVDGVNYEQKKHAWLSTNDPVVVRGFERLRKGSGPQP